MELLGLNNNVIVFDEFELKLDPTLPEAIPISEAWLVVLATASASTHLHRSAARYLDAGYTPGDVTAAQKLTTRSFDFYDLASDLNKTAGYPVKFSTILAIMSGQRSD